MCQADNAQPSDKAHNSNSEDWTFQGHWEDSNGTIIVIEGNTLHRSDGTICELRMQGRKCQLRGDGDSGELTRGYLATKHQLLWETGAVWVRHGEQSTEMEARRAAQKMLWQAAGD